MSVNEVLVRMQEIRARMAFSPIGQVRTGTIPPVGDAAAAGGAPGVAPPDFQSTLASITGATNTGNTGQITQYPGTGLFSTNPDLGQQMANYALQYVGTPYVAGGDTPQTGWDCAAFTDWVASSNGIDLPPVSWEQIKKGEPVASITEAKAGDLVFFHEPDGHSRDPSPLKVNHVGVYLGDGRMVDAANPSAGTRISDVDVAKLVGIRRLAGSMTP